jgi:hypothetical protein
MNPLPQITFDCVPLRSVPRWDIPLDASQKFRALCTRIRLAAKTHGLHNSYYLHSGSCTFQLTSDPSQGTLTYAFEGTILTDAADRKPVAMDLHVWLAQEAGEWTPPPVLAWFQDTVRRAVLVEFKRFIAQCDPQQTCARLEQIEAEMIRRGGFVGMGL